MGSEAALTGSRQGSVYCAAKFGLRGFAQALREECANQNTHIGIINPGMVRTPFFEAQPFEPGPSVNNALHVDDVVDAVMLMFNANDNAVIDEINLSPLTHVCEQKAAFTFGVAMSITIAMWSGPRNISTAMMRAWENRPDCTVWDEPLYAAYLHDTGIDHPMREAILQHDENDWRKVIARCAESSPDDNHVFYQNT